jgi:hypothetical protein
MGGCGFESPQPRSAQKMPRLAWDLNVIKKISIFFGPDRIREFLETEPPLAKPPLQTRLRRPYKSLV